MHNKESQAVVSKQVMEKIRSGEVRMRPGLYYSIVTTLTAASVLVVGLVFSYLMSIMIFWIRIEVSSGAAYGARRNLAQALQDFPWFVLAFAAVLVACLVVFVRHFGSLYKVRWQALAIGIVLFGVVVGSILSYTSVPIRQLPGDGQRQCGRTGMCEPRFHN